MKSRESFAGRFLLLCGSNLVLQVLSFLYRILLSRYAGTEGLGIYRLASSVYSILHATCLSGITLACTRYVSAWKAERKEGAVGALLRWIFTIFTFLFVISAVCIWWGKDYIGEVLIGDRRIIGAIPIMLICLLLTSIENIFKSVMIGLERIDNAVISELTEQIVRMLAAIILLRGFCTDDLGHAAVLIFCASVISEVVSASIMTVMYLIMRKPKRVDPPPRYRKNICQTVFPVSLSALCNNLIASSGTVLLPKRLTASGMTSREAVSELGALTGVAAPIIVLPMALITSLCTVTLPEISARYNAQHPQRMYDFSEKILRTVGLISVPFTILLIPLAPVISRLFFYHAVEQKIFVLMGFSCILCYYQMATSCFLNGCGQQTWNAAVVTCGELLQLFLIWFLTADPHLRLYGYILAQCITPLAVTICNFGKLRRTGIIRVRLKTLMLEPVICGLLLFLWSRVFFVFYSGFAGQWAAILLTLMSALLLYILILRLLDVELIRYLTKTVRLHTFQPMFY